MPKCHAHLPRRENQLTPGETETAAEETLLIDSTQHLLNCCRCTLTLADYRVVV